MIRNYCIIAIRSLWRNKLISSINLLGMAIGFAIFLTFWSWIRFDYSFDRFHEDIDQMYILNVEIMMEDSEYTSERVGGIFGSVLPDLFPNIISACRISQQLEFDLGVAIEEDSATVSTKYFNEDEILAVDTSFMDFFSFELLKGNPDQVFPSRDHMLITESLAKRLFGDQESIGKEVRLGNGDYYEVSGVVEDPPLNSSYQFKALIGFHIMEELGYEVDRVRYNNYYTNLRLAPDTEIKALNKLINDWVKSNFDLEIESHYFLTRLTDMHLYGESKGIIGFYMNLIMALGIMAIACINYLNLTSAYYSTRVGEIIIRKSVGASRKQLMIQFLGETYLLLLLALYLGLFLAEHLVPILNGLFGVDQTADFKGGEFWLMILLLFILTGFLAGFYPALKISGLNPFVLFVGKAISLPYRRSWTRRVLLVVQLSFSVIFILFSVFMIRQYVYMKEADLGFNRKDVVYIRTTGQAWEKYSLIKKELKELHYVEGISSGSNVPVMLSSGTVDWGERNGENNKLAVTIGVSYDFLSTFEIDLIEGSFFREGNDSLNNQYVVVNRELINLMGWKDPVGRKFYMWGRDYEILGVTENIEFFPFNLGVFEDRALIYRFDPVSNYIFVRLKTGSKPEQLAEILSVFETYNPGYEVVYDFVSNFQLKALENGEGLKFIFILISSLAIFIAAMGLIGLSAFHNSSRTKEVGIRKAMGAHTGIILRLLLSDFMKLVIISNLIALPLAFLFLRIILQFFAYRIELQTMVFVLVSLLSVLGSLITVIYHALKSSRSNPVDCLRYE